MNVLAINELAQLKASITALSKAGKYGEAVRKINTRDLKSKTYLSSDDLDGFLCGALCCEISQNLWFCGPCCGFMAIVECCGGEVAGVCCGCDWLIDECCY